MNRLIENIPVVLPPALDPEEKELMARERFLSSNEVLEDDFETAGLDGEDVILLDESTDDNEEEPTGKQNRRAKWRKSLIFLLIFTSAFMLLIIVLSWALGIGLFAPANRISVDRNQKLTGTGGRPETTGDEKLKTALAIVAGQDTKNENSPAVISASTNPGTGSEQDLTLSSGNPKGQPPPKNQLPGNMIVLPDEKANANLNGTQNQGSAALVTPAERVSTTSNQTLTARESQNSTEIKPDDRRTGSNKKESAVADSVFFGRTAAQNVVSAPRAQLPREELLPARNPLLLNKVGAKLPAFGTLLPARLLGAVYTLRGAGNLVRMELSRAVKQNGFSYPAGTILVGNLRGSDYNRAFITVVGLIDPQSGQMVKISGEVLGTDGASGITGTRKSVKSWGTKFLNALRETGGQAVNVLSTGLGRGGGGTVVLSGSSGINGELSSVIRNDASNDNFVEVRAGTEAYVLITGLPDEQSKNLQNNDVSTEASADQIGINLSDAELAELLSTNDPDKIRAALLKMSPQLRALAIQVMEEGKD